MATIYNFQKAATLENDSQQYWNKHYCVNQLGDSSGEYVSLADYNLVTSQRDALLALLAPLEQTTAALEYLFTREGYPPDASQEMMQAAHAAIAQARGE